MQIKSQILNFLTSLNSSLKRLFRAPWKLLKKNSADRLIETESSPQISALEVLQRIDISHRIQVHLELHQLLQNRNSFHAANAITRYALGNVDGAANFCAQKERDQGQTLAQEIENANSRWTEDVAKLVRQLALTPQGQIQQVLDHTDIDYLKLSICSEIAMVLSPHLHAAITKRSLYAFFKIRAEYLPLILPTPLLNDQQLIATIVKKYSSWDNYYLSVTETWEQFYEHYLKSHFPDSRYRFFYVEAFWNELYESVASTSQSLNWSKLQAELNALKISH